MMLGRAVCVVGAVLTFHFSGWLAAAFLVGAAVLPWAAVLLANNRPAKQALRFRRFLPAANGPAQLTASAVNPPPASPAEPTGAGTARKSAAPNSTAPRDQTVRPDAGKPGQDSAGADRRVIDL
jgi:hypothetical protein